MAKQNINVGTAANDKKGDSLRAAFQKVNANFTELYTELGLVVDANLNLGAFEFAGSTLSTTDSSAIVIDQATTITSNLSVGGDIVPQTANGGDLGSSTLPWRSLYVSNNTIFLGGVPLGIDANGNLTVNGSQIAGGGGGSSLVNGNKTVSLDTDGNLTLPSQGKIMPVGDVNSFLTFNYGDDVELKAGDNLYLSGSVATIRTNGNANQWIFGTDGTLTAPGTITASNLIVDAGNISFLGNGSGIQGAMSFNLSTNNFTNNWNFSQDGTLSLPNNGSLTFPDGTTQTTAWTGFSVAADDSTQRLINADEVVKFIGAGGITTASDAEGNITITGTIPSSLVNGAYSVEVESTGAFKVNAQAIVSENQFGIEGNGLVQLQTANGGSYLSVWNEGNTKEINLVLNDGVDDFQTWTFNTDRTLILPNDSRIKSATNIDITIDTPDSSTFNWRFGADGTLTLPLGGVIAEGGGISGAIKLTPAGGANANQALLIYPTGFAEGDHIHLTAGGGSTELYLGDDFHFVKLTSDGFVVIKADDGVNGAVWGFSPDGTTSIPGDIKSDSNINIDINLSDSTLRRWQFGEDGNLTFPDGTNQATAWTGSTTVSSLVNGAHTLSLGSTGLLALPNNGKITSGISTAQVGSTTTIALNDQGTDQAYDVTYLGIAWTGNEAVFTTYAAGSTITFANGDVRTINDIQKNEVYGSPGEFVIDIYWSASRANLTAFPITLKTSNYAAAYTAPEWQFGTDGALTTPGNITLPNGSVIKDTDYLAVAFGSGAGTISQGFFAVAVGADAGYNGQGNAAVAIGGGAGQISQGLNAVAIGQSAGYTGQGINAVAIGINAGYTNQAANSIILNATGATLNQTTANTFTVAPIRNISATSGVLQYNDSTKEVSYSNSVTAETFNTDQITIVGNRISTTVTNANLELECNGTGGVVVNRITLTNGAVIKDTEDDAVAFGQSAGGASLQGTGAVAIGRSAGNLGQSLGAVAVGSQAGQTNQGWRAVAIGDQAGPINQGQFSIAIGYGAGNGDAVANSIIINATGSNLVSAAAGFYVAPIRNISATSGVLQYNDSTKEVSYNLNVTAETFNTDQITVVGNRITTTVTNANLELECNGTGGVVINTVADATTASTVKSVGYLGLPQSATATSATLAIGDAGKHIYVTTASQTITIPANASVAYPIGTTLTFIAGPSATTVLIAITSDTLRLAGGTSTGQRTLAANGMATAVKVAATTWYINGTGLT